MIASQHPTATKNWLCMDLEQVVMFVPMLTHSDIFYSRQLSCYNLRIDVSNINSAYMCMWHECIGGCGANEIASCFFKVITYESLSALNRLVLWCSKLEPVFANDNILFGKKRVFMQ